MAKAIVLFSGGLDSQLACLILMKEGVQVTPVFFETYFFRGETAKKYASEIGLTLRIEDISEEHLKIVQNPPHGYGKNMNPCVDCHMLMIKKAKEIMESEGFDFIVTGEVLDERPFSQRYNVFEEMETVLNLKGKIVRPLSQKLLEESVPEKEGWIKRENMLEIKGRSRKPQIELARKFGLTVFETPASGCILTDPAYSERLRNLRKINPIFDGNDTQIIRNGRVVFENDSVIVIGRNEKEDKILETLKKEKDVVLKPIFPGPTVLVRPFKERINEEFIERAKKLLIGYSKKAPKDATEKIEIIKGA